MQMWQLCVQTDNKNSLNQSWTNEKLLNTPESIGNEITDCDWNALILELLFWNTN